MSWIRPHLPRHTRASISALLCVLAAASPTRLHAQPKLPDVKLPDAKVPDVKAPDVKAPEVKAPEAKAPEAKPAEDKPAEDKAEKPKPNTLTDESEVVLFADPKKPPKTSIPTTLPPELAPNVKKGSKAGFRDKAAGPVTIEEIVNSPVTTASKRRESATEAPAWVLVVTAKDIRDRGYTDLSQVLDDLPGIDVIRPGGEYYVRNYVRGYRSITAEPYLVLLDGVVFNHLFYRHGQIMATFPLTDVDHIEIAYGPASAVYGANAAMGLINIITKSGREEQEHDQTGAAFRSRLIFGGPQGNFSAIGDPTKIVDATAMYINRSWRFRLSGRFEDGVWDKDIDTRSDYPYSTESLYSNPNIWNQTLLDEYPTLAGDFHSVDRKAGIDARLFLGEGTEIAAQLFTHSTGFGTVYPADRQQTSGLWTNQEISLYGRHITQLSPSVHSTTLIQFRHSSVASPTTYLAREDDPTGMTAPQAVLYSRSSPHFGVLVTQDFDVSAPRSLLLPSDELSIGAGLRFQHVENNLGTGFLGYDDLAQSWFPLDSTDPVGNSEVLLGQHQVPTLGVDDLGGYVMAKYRFFDAHALHAGARLEHGSLRDNTNVVFRGGYVGKFVLHEKSDIKSGQIEQIALTAKLLYGQAVYEPGVYELVRTRLPSDDTLDEEALDAQEEPSHTIEANLDLTVRKWLALHADGYYFQSTAPLIDTHVEGDVRSEKQGFVNLATRSLAGFDVGARFFYKPFHIWAYYSRLLLAQDVCDGISLPDTYDCSNGSNFVGDVSLNKLWGGITFDKAPFTATLIGRFMGARDTVITNPIRSVASYGTLDANVTLTNVPWNGFSFGLRVTNILGTQYSHPGIHTADSGNATPTFAADGTYSGSAGEYNSLLLQPGRAFFGTIGFDLDPKEATSASK